MTHIQDIIPYLSDAVFEMERELPYAAAFASEREGEQITCQTRLQTVESLDPVRGVTLTGYTGRFFLETALNDLSPKAIKKAAKKLVRAAVDSGIRYNTPKIDPGPLVKEHFFVSPKIDPESLPLKEKTDHCRERLESIQAMDPRIVNGVFSYATVRVREVFVNRKKEMYQSLRRTQAVATIVMAEKQKTANLHEGRCFQGGWEHADLDRDLLAAMVEDCARLLPAERLEPGTYDCIFSPEFAGIFAHEAFGHGTEADMILKRRGRGALFLNKYVASPLVNMYDDPTLPGQAASYFFDHEGQLASPTHIIKDGVLIHPLTDLNSAIHLNIDRTANGRRESYAHKAYARMSNTYFAPSDHKLDDMLADISHGYLLDRASNGMEDPKGWGIQIEGHIAREIKNGKLTGAVFSPVIVTGYVPDLLKSVSMVGGDLHISGLGMCGKGYKEWVKVTDGGPHMRLKARLG